MKKIFTIVTSLVIAALIIPGGTQALTAAELQVQIDALLAQLSTLQSQLTALQTPGAVSGCTITSFSRNLKQGMTGDDVKCLQVILNSAADTKVAASGAGSPGNETTYFGALTKAAVVKFQVKYASEVLTPLGLTAGTGFVGSATRTKLNTMLVAGPVCGNATCESGETTTSCPADCVAGGPVCGNAICETGETSTTCPADCPVIPVAAGLNVALAADTPVAATVVGDSTSGDGGQALAEFVKIRFATAVGTSAKVTTLKITRSGIAADTDLPNMYLFDGATKIADTPSAASRVFTFTNAGGLFTVSGEKVITVKADIVGAVSAGKTIALGVNAASDIVTDATAVTGTFPITGNTMTTASISDLGKLTLATVSDPGTAITAGLTDQELWRFSLAAADQKIKVSKIKLTVVGTISATDLGNLYLSDGVSQIGSTAATLADDKTVTFNLSDSPYIIAAGITKQISVKGDLLAGASRSFYFSVRNGDDIVGMDNNYGVNVRLNQASTYTIIKAATTTTISEGSLQITLRSDAPTGNIAQGATNKLLAKFDVKAIGEAIKITSLTTRTILTATAAAGLDYGKVLVDGSQVGTSTDLVSAADPGGDTEFSLGSQFVVNAGQTKVLEIYADIKASSGVALASGETITTNLKVGSNNYLRMTSGTSGNTPVTTANTLTVTASALSSVKNTSIAARTLIYKSTNVLIGSWLITAGSAEGVDVTSIVISDGGVGTYALGDAFQNLTLWSGGKQYGQMITSPNTTAAQSNTFSLSTNLRIPAGQSVRVDLQGDVLGSPSWTTNDYAKISSITGVGLVTSTTVSDSTGANGQLITVSSAGTLTVTNAASPTMPNSTLLVFGDTAQALGAWNFTASNTEDLKVTRIEVREYQQEAPGNVKNLKLFVAGQQVPTASPITIDSLNTSTGSTYPLPYAIFENTTNGLFTVPAGGTVALTLKGDVTPYTNALTGTAGKNVRFRIVLPANGSITATSSISALGASSGTFTASSGAATLNANVMKTVRTKPTFAKVVHNTLLSAAIIDVLKFSITASSAYDVTFDGTNHNIRFTISSSKTTLTAGKNFKLYDSSNTLLQTVSATPNSAQTIDFNAITTTVPAGESVTYRVTGDLSDFTAATDSFRLTIENTATDLSWGDGVTSADISDAYVGKGLPMDGDVLYRP